MSGRIAVSLAVGLSLLVAAGAGAKSSTKTGVKKVADDPGCRTCTSQAASAFASNNLDEAVRLLGNWTDRCPRTAQLHLLYSTILMRQRKLPEAETEAQQAAAAQPDSLAARLQLAMCFMANGKYTQATGEFETATQINPGCYEAWSALGDLYKRGGEDQKSKEAADKASNLEPGTQAVRLSVLNNLKRSGKFAAAKVEIQKLLQNCDAGPEFMQSLSSEALLIGAYEEAENAARKVVDAYPKSSGALRTLALAQYMGGKFEAAATTADQLTAATGKSADGRAIKSLALLAAGKNADANKAAAEAESSDSSSCFALLASGCTKLENGELDQAKQSLESCIALDYKGMQGDKLPQSLAHVALSKLYIKQGSFADAIQESHNVAEDKRMKSKGLALESRAMLGGTASPEQIASAGKLAAEAAQLSNLDVDVLLALSLSEMKAGKFAEAKKFAEKAGAVAPASSDRFLIEAEIANSQGNLAEAKDNLSQGLKISGKDPALLFLAGQLALKENRTNDAIDFLKQSLANRNESAETNFALAEAYEKAGQSTSSVEHYKAGLSLGLPAPLTRAAQDAIKRLSP